MYEYKTDAIQALCVSGLVAILCVYPTHSEEKVLFLDTTNTTWELSCGGMGPAAVSGLNLDTFSIDGNFSFLSEGQKAWIGYYRRAQYFSLEGCSATTLIARKIPLINNTPGHCLSVCEGYNYTGLEVGMCYCITDDERKTISLNDTGCPYDECHGGSLCGNSRAIWVYSKRKPVFGTQIPQPSDKLKCIALETTGAANWTMDECKEPKRPLCLKNGSVFDEGLITALIFKSWILAVNTCRNKSENIGNIDRTNFRDTVLHVSFSSAWTSFIFDAEIVKGGHNFNRNDSFDCGTLEYSRQQAKLSFGMCGKRIPAICERATPTSADHRMTATLINQTHENPSTTASSATETKIITTNTTKTVTATTITINAVAITSNTIKPSTILSNVPDIHTSNDIHQSTISTFRTSIPELSNLPMTSTKTTLLITSGTYVKSSTSPQNHDFPIYGWIGIGTGIIVVLVIACVVLGVRRCKRKDNPLSHQISMDNYDRKDKMFKGFPMSDIHKKEIKNNEEGNEINNDKVDAWLKTCNPRNSSEKPSDTNGDSREKNANVQNSTVCQAKRAVIKDKDSASHVYAIVDISAKRSPKMIETSRVFDTSVYDQTYGYQPRRSFTKGDCDHIYDHANFKNNENLP